MKHTGDVNVYFAADSLIMRELITEVALALVTGMCGLVTGAQKNPFCAEDSKSW